MKREKKGNTWNKKWRRAKRGKINCFPRIKHFMIEIWKKIIEKKRCTKKDDKKEHRKKKENE